MTAEPRPLRADARRNRERLLDAAVAVFTEKGTAASTEEVARRAGVGIGTVFRHFPSKEALLTAVYGRLLDELVERARELADAEDPGAAFHEFAALVVQRAAAKNAMADALAEAGVELPPAGPQSGGADTAGGSGDSGDSGGHGELSDALGTLLRRAQDAGAVRADLTFGDLQAVLIGISRAVAHLAGDPAARERVAAAMLSGLRPAP